VPQPVVEAPTAAERRGTKISRAALIEGIDTGGRAYLYSSRNPNGTLPHTDRKLGSRTSHGIGLT
jgi:hypothetical protein